MRIARAMGFLLTVAAPILAVAMLSSTSARAQFACAGAGDVTCTNTGATAVPFLQDQVGAFNLTTISSGLSNGITTTSVDGNVTATNSGLNADMLDTSASGLGNATSNNSGTIGSFIATLTGSGNATTMNSGTVVQDITTMAQDGGNALTNNSGSVIAISTYAISSGPVYGSATTINSGLVSDSILTSAEGGGNATTHNSGTVAGSIGTFTTNSGSGSGGGNATSFNSGTADSISNITNDGGNATVVNSGNVLFNGSCCAPTAGIFNGTASGGDATTINTGNVNGGIYTMTGLTSGGGNATLVNYGTIRGDVVTIASAGFSGTGNATFINFGTIYTDYQGVGVGALDGKTTGYNAGRIYGEVDVGNALGGTATFSNAGLIDGTYGAFPTGVALDLSQGDPSIPTNLNILPGSRIIGEIVLNGDTTDPFAVGTKVNILGGHDISSVLTFGSLSCGCGGGIVGGLIDTGSTVNVTGGAPYVINGNTVAILDPTSFAMQDRNVVDVTRTVTSLATSRLTNPAPIGGNGSMAIGFAPSGNVARDMVNDAFSGIPALAYASNDRVLLSNPSFTTADGTSVWAQGFGGQRIQQATAPTLRSVNSFYGGVLGVDKTVQPGLRLGAFIGGGAITSNIDLNSGRTSSDIGFGGVYGRYAMGRAFLDFSLLGGYSSNDVKRTIANNLVPGGYEYAAGKYNGWFISPEIAYGFQRSLGSNLTLTPSARVRYLAAGFGGYDETGSTTNLSVRSRTSHNFEERGEFKLTHTTKATPTEQLQLSGTAGLVALQRLGDSSVNTILLGQGLAFNTPGKASVIGFYAGAGFDWRNASGISVFGAAEFTAMSDSSQTVTGRGGVKFSF